MKVKARMCLPVGSIASHKSNSFLILKHEIPKLPKPSYLKKPEPTCTTEKNLNIQNVCQSLILSSTVAAADYQ